FKAINDHHGHAAGDAYLARFAGLLHSVVRHADLVVRMGGEEFLVVLHRAPRDVAERVAKDVVERTRDLAMDVGGVRVHTTASIGIAAGRGGDDMTDLIQQADRALYMAKTSGRDRVCVAGPTDARTGREPLSR
ncbi:MAG: GGDEF domain-containing protein, partial [Lysobacteraceae bacterium]